MTEHLVTTRAQLDEMIEALSERDEFVFDVETRGSLEDHPDLAKVMEEELAAHCASLKNTSDAALAKVRARFEDNYRKAIAVDPARNDLLWIGLALEDESWAVPLGHPHGELLEAEEIGDGSTVPPPGYRKILKSGRESMAKARYHKPAVFGPAPPQLERAEVLDALRPLFFSDRRKVGHNVKFDARTLGRYIGLPPGPYGDTMMAAHIANENLRSYDLAALIAEHFDGAKPYEAEGKVGKVITQVPFDVAARYLLLDVGWTMRLWCKLYRQIHDEGLMDCFDAEMDTLWVLMRMEDAGIRVDSDAMWALQDELHVRLDTLREDLCELAGSSEFNPDSTPSKARFLFDDPADGGLGLTPVKLTKTGQPSTDSDSLEQLIDAHPIVPKILEWQELTKILGTYVDGLLPKLNDGRLHCSFNLHRTATGRLSSSGPNLQNIPAHSDLGKTIRAMFVAREGCELIVADYDQIELRVMAMFSQDPEMLRIFANGIDIHTGTAALIFDKPVESISKGDPERQIGKAVNFLTAFGGGAARLAAGTGVTEERAQEFLSAYFTRFAGLAAWKRAVILEARTKTYVTTLSGRRRRLPELYYREPQLRSRAERQAVNTVVQGTASDICKRAMIEVDRLLSGTPARLLVQVHDELVIEAPAGESEFYGELLTKGMGHGTVLAGVPLTVEYNTGRSWAEAK